ncbi:hypothetical protein LVJ85_02435 [Neisseria sp. Dent CA1/247]|uniref:hypothetical protein n=1 Tax=Neisseria sp. Dent CA1/247 TaxID=2912675 RepID=UPI001FD4D53A|nr:hypothetical protein [Neisseria sp. Dent CA1/247]UOO77375.1 hypothetical protein LVJ85_02435 [Neisseria sp. Dent CA1/247]
MLTFIGFTEVKAIAKLATNVSLSINHAPNAAIYTVFPEDNRMPSVIGVGLINPALGAVKKNINWVKLPNMAPFVTVVPYISEKKEPVKVVANYQTNSPTPTKTALV